ncbi:AraC family transcriptional regulator [Actinoplanes sp. URMC 104]|uniref:AraC family transcriptional regulator n=1 Tax=Actinoplanes sp. URMC 104 TaxID=3423409 RepID=UPI003F1DBF5C
MPGILDALAAADHFRYAQTPPSADLAPFVVHHWQVSWDLTGREPFTQWVLPFPSVNITFTAGRCRVAGVPRGRFCEVLTGAGRVVGTRFRPGGFRPFAQAEVATLTGRFVGVHDFYGEAGRALAEVVPAADDAAAVREIEAFLRSFRPVRDADAELVAVAVDRAEADPAIVRADQLAAATGTGLRRLQRLFRVHVGVGPKWLIRRYRLHEAAERLTAGGELDLGRLAGELGYSDQAHLTRDFTALIGAPPARYAQRQ